MIFEWKCSMCFEMTKSSTISKKLKKMFKSSIRIINLVKIFICFMGRSFLEIFGWN